MNDEGGGAEPAQTMKISSLTESERARVRECLQWLHEQGAMWGPELDDRRIAEGYDRALAEARRRWPDVARLIGFDAGGRRPEASNEPHE